MVASSLDDVAAEFEAIISDDLARWEPSFNIAPTDQVPVVLERTADDPATPPRREVHTARWGLVQPWAKDLASSAKMINARLETAATRPAYRAALAKRRCVVPASGYYEWQKLDDGRKQPHFIHPADDGLLAMAGLFEWWPNPDLPPEHPDRWTLTTTILTTTPTPALAPIHDRMPALLTPDQIGDWLDRRTTDSATLTAALTHTTLAVAAGLAARPVSPAVGRVATNHPGLTAPLRT